MKMVPGADVAQIERLTALATRVPFNLEAPSGDTLARIAPEKNLSKTLWRPGEEVGAYHLLHDVSPGTFR